MQRDNHYDLSILDRSRSAMRDQGRKANRVSDVAGIGGSCGLDGARVTSRPSCDSYELSYLDKNFTTTSASARNIAAGANALITFDPLDQVFWGVAISMFVSQTANATTPSVAWVLDANIRKCTQMDFTNAVETAAGATSWIPSVQWDPTARSGCACPINWGAFTNSAGRSAVLTVLVTNPTSTPIDVIIMIHGLGFVCCPGFISGGEQNMHLPGGRTGPEPTPNAPPAPIGRPALFK